MQLHQLKPSHKRKDRKRVGRGGKRGTYSGRGLKGQKSRAGRRLKPIIREMIKRYPKLRGYRFKPILDGPVIVNLTDLEKKFKNNEKVTPKSLLAKKIISKIKGRVPQVKILGQGRLQKPLIVENCQLSKSAKERIEKAGGKVKFKVQSSKLKVESKVKSFNFIIK